MVRMQEAVLIGEWPVFEYTLSYYVVDCAGLIDAGLKWLANAGCGAKPKAGQSPLDNLTLRYNQKMKTSASYWPLTPSLRIGTNEPHRGYTWTHIP